MEKRKITLTAIILGIVLVALFGSTYAYFTSNNDPKSSLDATITTGSLSLILDDVDGITEEDKIDANHTTIVKYFSITNSGTEDAYAKLIFKGLTNTFVRDDLVYELEEVQSDKSSFSTARIELSETVVPKSGTPSNQVLADSIFIEKGTITNNTVTPNTKYYKLTVKYKYSNTVNQNEDLGATLVSGFTIEEGTYQTRVVTTNGVEMRLDNSSINSTIAPNASVQKTFRLRNNTNTTQKVDVELTNITNTNENTTASLDKDGTTIVDSVSVPVGTNESIVLKSGLEVPSNDNSAYTITINNTDTNSSNISANVNTKKNNVISCMNETGEKIECSTTLLTKGQIIKIGTEEFRYLSTSNGVIKMLAQYNLYIGSIYNSSGIKVREIQLDEEGYGWQSPLARGYVEGQDAIGTCKYAGKEKSCQEFCTNEYNGSIIKDYVDDYVQRINKKYFESKNIVSGTIPTRADVGCGYEHCHYNNNPSWVWYTSYYTKEKGEYNTQVYVISSYGSNQVEKVVYSDMSAKDEKYGARPLIMISETDLNNLFIE